MHAVNDVNVFPEQPFSLALSAAPAAWGSAQSPRHAIAERGLLLVEGGHDGPVWMYLEQSGFDVIRVRSSASNGIGKAWLDHIFRRHNDVVWSDRVIAGLAEDYPGFRSFTDGSLFLGLVTSIIGQSISIASAMAAQRRLAFSFSEGVEVFGRTLAPLPDAAQLADASVELIRSSGVTWKRAEALKAIARDEVTGSLPSMDNTSEDYIERSLMALPMIGKWTAASARLWGVGAADAYPTGDVALLRAARFAYDDAGMTMKDLDRLAESWRPYRGVATRLLWTHLLGPAWKPSHEEPHEPQRGHEETTNISHRRPK